MQDAKNGWIYFCLVIFSLFKTVVDLTGRSSNFLVEDLKSLIKMDNFLTAYMESQ